MNGLEELVEALLHAGARREQWRAEDEADRRPPGHGPDRNFR